MIIPAGIKSAGFLIVYRMKTCEFDHELTIEKVMEILRENGTFVTASEAEIILNFMINLASLSLQHTST